MTDPDPITPNSDCPESRDQSFGARMRRSAHAPGRRRPSFCAARYAWFESLAGRTTPHDMCGYVSLEGLDYRG